MGEYISRDDALLHSEIIRVYSKDYGNIDVVPVEYLADIPAADVQPVRKWVNDKILSPSVDGDYLVLYRGYFNVFERFKGKWFDEKGVEVDTKDLIWWQELPELPKEVN